MFRQRGSEIITGVLRPVTEMIGLKCLNAFESTDLDIAATKNEAYFALKGKVPSAPCLGFMEHHSVFMHFIMAFTIVMPPPAGDNLEFELDSKKSFL